MQMLKEVDTNRDGIIDFEEFVDIMLAQESEEEAKKKLN
jgi:Ca2+-binding EF-hand superfamily protein